MLRINRTLCYVQQNCVCFIMCIPGHKCYLGEFIPKKVDIIYSSWHELSLGRKVGHTLRNIILSCLHSSDEIS